MDDGVRDSGDGSVAVVLDSAVLMAASPVEVWIVRRFEFGLRNFGAGPSLPSESSSLVLVN